MTDFVSEERKTLKQYRSVTSMTSFLIGRISNHTWNNCCLFSFSFLLNWYWKSALCDVTPGTGAASLPHWVLAPSIISQSLKCKFQRERKRHLATPRGHFWEDTPANENGEQKGPVRKVKVTRNTFINSCQKMQFFFHSSTIMHCIIQLIADVFINCEYKTERKATFFVCLKKNWSIRRQHKVLKIIQYGIPLHQS